MLRPIKHFYHTYSNRKLFILVSFVVCWPLAAYLMWRHHKWSVKTRSIVTTVFAGLTLLVGIVGYNAPPSLSLADNSIITGYKTDDDFMVIAGKVSTLHSPKLIINGKQVSADASGNFRYRLRLAEGDTDVNIVAESEKGDDAQHFKVHRTTTAEFAERKKIAEERKKAAAEEAVRAKAAAIEAMPVCDGTSVTSHCKADGGIYKTYVYHPAVAAKTHQETQTTYKEEVTGYCTLCADGTYSPTCATGRGACSWHGGVAQWNAPITSKVPIYTYKQVIDEPAKDAYYDKILDERFE